MVCTPRSRTLPPAAQGQRFSKASRDEAHDEAFTTKSFITRHHNGGENGPERTRAKVGGSSPPPGSRTSCAFLKFLRRRWTSCDCWISYGAEMEFLTSHLRLLTPLWTFCAPPLELLRSPSDACRVWRREIRVGSRCRLYEAAGRGNVNGTPDLWQLVVKPTRERRCANFWTVRLVWQEFVYACVR